MRSLLLFVVITAAACGPSTRFGVDGGGNNGDGGGNGSCNTPNATRCNGLTYQTCTNGNWTDTQTCTQPNVCVATLGCAACDPQLMKFCSGDTVYNCNPDGTVGSMVQQCAFEACSGGACQDPCGAAAQNRSYIGCEYWPVDLDNAIEVLGEPISLGGPPSCDAYTSGTGFTASTPTLQVCLMAGGPFGNTVEGLCDYGGDCSASPGTTCSSDQVCTLDAEHSPFAVVVANPDPSASAMVTLSNASGQSTTVMVAPGAVQSIFPQMAGLPDQSLDNSMLGPKAYKLVSDHPIVAYQFNPLDNVGVFSNDASLLIPSSAYDTNYYTVTYATLARRPMEHDYNGYVTIVASGPGSTTVMVTPTAAVRAGMNVPAIAKGTTQSFSLNQFDVLNLESVEPNPTSGDSGDLTGTVITASQPVGVFGGTEATGISPPGSSGNCCADHLEDQIFPASTWGKAYAIARSQMRRSEPDLLRIIAQKAGTTVTFNPAPVSGSCGTLNAGQFCDVWIQGDTEVTGSEPIMVGHYIVSVGLSTDTTNPPGDPAIDFAVPTEQFRLNYQFLVPSQYMSNYISLVAPTAGTVALDGNDVTGQLANFGSGTFKGGRVSVNAGPHKLDCPMGCGVEVMGYDGAVSYLFAGGLDLKQIVVSKEVPATPHATGAK
jgi:hypothetical protein